MLSKLSCCIVDMTYLGLQVRSTCYLVSSLLIQILYFVVVMESPLLPKTVPGSCWGFPNVLSFTLPEELCESVWNSPLYSFLATRITLGLGMLPFDKVLVFCETKILNWGGYIILSWEISQDAIKTSFAYGKICKHSLSKKYMFLFSDEAGKRSNLPMSFHMGNFWALHAHSLYIFHFSLGL